MSKETVQRLQFLAAIANNYAAFEFEYRELEAKDSQTKANKVWQKMANIENLLDKLDLKQLRQLAAA